MFVHSMIKCIYMYERLIVKMCKNIEDVLHLLQEKIEKSTMNSAN